MGLPVQTLLLYVGSRVRSNGNSHVTLVDPFGNGVASAPGGSGDHARRLHARTVNSLVKLVKAVGVPVKGGYDAPCTNFFSKSFDAGARIDVVSVRLIQGIIPKYGHRRSRLRTWTFSLEPDRWRQNIF